MATIDERVTALEKLIKASPVADFTGLQRSYPVEGQQMTSDMWGNVTLGVGNGILDRGGYPYDLININNSRNTVTIKPEDDGPAAAIVNGYYHELHKNAMFTVPAPSSGTVTYNIVLQYDPAGHNTEAGPVQLKSISGEPVNKAGMVTVKLHSITRRANQLLTDAEIVNHRPRIAPTIYVHRKVSMPAHDSVLYGTMCVVRTEGRVYTRMMERWEPLEPQVERVNLSGTGTGSVWGANSYILREGPYRRLFGRLRRADGTNFEPTSAGYGVYTIPYQDRPQTVLTAKVAAGSGDRDPRFVKCAVDGTDKVWRLYPTGSTPYIDFHDFTWRVD
ncbi:hypothetical protein [Pseudoglutamicibacter cumminsii]|uniref:hypothetical protein n=1 Tax=Pseudoglutamicibacter cumminsii TaxID=156979 RepID=UPI0021A52825|nr:hypothetical protein [Pseudoglutamicibacter cumminsii]MCT1686292.1 hypothetical protein [Pseudoglutamicibacter cumminsii]